jgi:hypothetical protein
MLSVSKSQLPPIGSVEGSGAGRSRSTWRATQQGKEKDLTQVNRDSEAHAVASAPQTVPSPGVALVEFCQDAGGASRWEGVGVLRRPRVTSGLVREASGRVETSHQA